jgi:DNA adenine methylase
MRAVAPAPDARPFLKWVGGKRQLLPVLRTYYPPMISGYHEPFLGSGAVFFDLWASGRLAGRPVWLSDENPDLVGCYLRVRDAVDAVIGELERLSAGHAAGGRDFYYEVRDQRFNPQRAAWTAAGGTPHDYPVELAAALLYLNKTGYNGLFRLNQKGGYNVPAGRYLRPRIVNPERLRAAAAALGGPRVTIACQSFDQAADRARPGEFIYFDPPYAPLGPTSNFRHYTARGFSDDDQNRLQALAVGLAGRGVHVLLSNSSADSIVRLYGERTAQSAGLRMRRVAARRAINTRGDRRGPVDELLVTNLPTAVQGPRAVAH